MKNKKKKENNVALQNILVKYIMEKALIYQVTGFSQSDIVLLH